jgi:antitoxin component YwqK of YwqJK toxin-antitoxin module
MDSEVVCYVCFEHESKNEPYAESPCICKGSIVIHKECLKSVIKKSRNCSICKTHYNLKYLPQRDGKELIKKKDINGERIEYTVNEKGERHGSCIIKSSDGDIKTLYTYINGIMEGPYTEYHPNGQIKSVCKCRNGRIEGEYNEWDRNGQLVEESQYKNGVKHGECIRWFQKGYIRVSKVLNYVDGDADDCIEEEDY